MSSDNGWAPLDEWQYSSVNPDNVTLSLGNVKSSFISLELAVFTLLTVMSAVNIPAGEFVALLLFVV